MIMNLECICLRFQLKRKISTKELECKKDIVLKIGVPALILFFFFCLLGFVFLDDPDMHKQKLQLTSELLVTFSELETVF